MITDWSHSFFIATGICRILSKKKSGELIRKRMKEGTFSRNLFRRNYSVNWFRSFFIVKGIRPMSFFKVCKLVRKRIVLGNSEIKRMIGTFRRWNTWLNPNSQNLDLRHYDLHSVMESFYTFLELKTSVNRPRIFMHLWQCAQYANCIKYSKWIFKIFQGI